MTELISIIYFSVQVIKELFKNSDKLIIKYFDNRIINWIVRVFKYKKKKDMVSLLRWKFLRRAMKSLRQSQIPLREQMSTIENAVFYR